MKYGLIFFCMVTLLVLGVAVIAQDNNDDCPMLVADALDLAQQVCERATSSELCYGHFVLEADPQIGTDDFKFEEPGDVEAVTDVRSLRLSAMDASEDIWGVAVMRVRAILSGTIEPEDVVFLLFGDVVVENAITLTDVTVLRDGNVRADASANSALVDVVAGGDVLIADGRSADNTWIRIRRDNDQLNGWISTSLIETTPALAGLPVEDVTETADDQLLYGAMQAFYFRSGINDSPCEEAPNSGLLIQTPEGEAEVTLLMNEANIQLRATAYVQAEPGQDMTVYVIEGEATIEADGEERTLVSGTSLTIPLNEDGQVDGPPSDPESYDITQLQALPVNLLDRPVEVADPLNQTVGVPLSGDWNFNWLVNQAECPDGQVVDFATENPRTSIRVDESGDSFVMLLTRYNRDASGIYRTVFTDASGNVHTYSLQVSALDRLNGSAQIDYLFGCSLTVPFELRLVNAAN